MLLLELFSVFEDFAAWFGNSKVVDADGKPLRVYHGTSAVDFDEFRKSRKPKDSIYNNSYGRDKHVGMFFTDDPENADYYSAFPGKGDPRTIPVFLSIQNPLVIDGQGFYKSPNKIIKWAAEAKRNGNDGLIIHKLRDTPTTQWETLYIAFKPQQIKSALGNNGNFDPKSKKITESGEERLWRESPDETVGEFLIRHRIPMENGKYVFYHATPKRNGAKTFLRKGSYLADDAATAVHQAGRDRDLSRKQINLHKLLLSADDIDPGVWCRLRNDFPIGKSTLIVGD